MTRERPFLELMLARNLVAALVTPAFVVDPEGVMTFFNEAAGGLIGRRFEESGRLSREDWNAIGPVDEHGAPLSSEDLPLTIALREGRPALGTFRIKTDDGEVLEVEASAIPLRSAEGFGGAIVTFVAIAPRELLARSASPAESQRGRAADAPGAAPAEAAAAPAGGGEPRGN